MGYIRSYYYFLKKKILTLCQLIRYFKKYNVIIPKIYYHIFWLVRKPNKVNFDNRNFYLSTKEQSEPSRQLYSYKKYYNSFEKSIIDSEVIQGSNCLDIGANIGFFTYLFLKKSGRTGKIYSFESNKIVFATLKMNFVNDKNVITYNGFVGTEILVDEIIKDEVHFIKIDIDGQDLIALKSCNNIINLYKPKIIIELSEASYRQHAIHYSDTIKFLKKKNYQCYEILKTPKLFDRNLKRNEVINIFAC